MLSVTFVILLTAANCPSLPTEGSTPVFLRVKGLKLSSIKTSPYWTETTRLSLLKVQKSLTRTYMDRGHPPLEQVVFLEPPGLLFQTGRSYRHKVNQKRLKKQGLERKENNGH